MASCISPTESQVLRVTTDGIIHTVAGDAHATAIGDGGPALAAGLNANSPGTPTFDSKGNMVIPEPGIDRLREVTATPYQLTLSLDDHHRDRSLSHRPGRSRHRRTSRNRSPTPSA